MSPYRFSAPGICATSLSGALLRARQRLADPGLSLEEIGRKMQADADRAAQGFNPMHSVLVDRARRFALVMAVETLPTGLIRDVAIELTRGGFDGTPQQLLAAARAIAD